MATEKELTYHKWYFDVVEDYRRLLTNEQMGELFFAVISYAKEGVKTSVADGITWPFQEQCRKVDAAKKSYAAKCETAARNGASGGRAKARNFKAKQEEAVNDEDDKPSSSFTPPTKTDFKNIAKHFAETDELEYDAYELDEFYIELKDAGWKIGGEPIRSRQIIQDALFARFAECSLFSNRLLEWKCFSVLFSKTHGQVTTDMKYNFSEVYKFVGGKWLMDGKEYSNLDDAVDAFLANLANGSDS